jgi:hypothetical protein
MASPLFLAAGSLVSTVVGAGISAYGQSKTAQANAQAATYQAQVAANNQKIAQQNAQFSLASGRQQAQIQDIKTGQNLGQIKAAQAASGLDVNTGSNLDVQQSAAEIGRLDTLTIMNNAMKQSGGFLAQGQQFTAESQLDTMKASAAQTAGSIGVASSILGGASSFSDKWLGYQQKGVAGF